MFSGEPQKISYGASNWQAGKSEEINKIINQLLTKYQMEGVKMPYTMEQFKQEAGLQIAMEYLPLLPAEERLKGIPAEERLKGLKPEIIKSYLSALENK